MTAAQGSFLAGWKSLGISTRAATSIFLFIFAPTALFGQQSYKATVTVDLDAPRTFMGVRAMGMHTSIYDNNLMDPEVPRLLRIAGITTLRYPGGGYADNYHFSTYKPTRWQAEEPPKYGYYNPKNHFGNFIQLLDRVPATAIITVNYGSNLAGTGGGEPAEAAAWVAYANGDPKDTNVIGVDSTGHDWKTVGYWATLRAAAPVAEDDGLNFLRISHPRPANILYWEIGNEVFGNGWYWERDKQGFEQDLHAPYTKERKKHPGLSPQTYGKNVEEFAKAMKAVDPRIKIGAVLNTPPMDNSWGPDWNPAVLKEAGQNIDFVVVHWYTGDLLPPDWKVLNLEQFVQTPQTELPKMTSALLELFKKYCGSNAGNIQLAVTELGARPFADVKEPLALAIFASDAYLSLMEAGTVNIDWLELHNNFLDDKNMGLPIFYALQIVHNVFRPNDTIVNSTTNKGMLTVHATKRSDGSVGVVLINKDTVRSAKATVGLKGANVQAGGVRFDYGKGITPTSAVLPKTDLRVPGGTFEIVVPAYAITGIVIPKAQ